MKVVSTCPQARLRAVIVDDHPRAREGLRTVLQLRLKHEVEVVGEADSGQAAFRLVQDLRPDIVFMDIGLPDMSGLEVTRQIKTLLPQMAVIVVTIQDDPFYRREAAALGVAGYVTKDRLWDMLPAVLQDIFPPH